jgi:hypothetical protein
MEQWRFDAENIRAWKSWLLLNNRREGDCVDDEATSEACWQTLTCGTCDGSEDEQAKERLDWEKIVGRWKLMSGFLDRPVVWTAYCIALGISLTTKNTILRNDAPVLFEESTQFSYGRRMFTSKDRYFGLGPRDVQIGDCLAFLEGGRVPYILRQKDQTYELVGDCYIDGVMKGERFDSTRCERIWVA